jgi:DNA-binding PadR family transcriptional regulator
VRLAILTLLDEQPMHGYELMQAIAERTGGRWTPSPGAVYPAINQLEDEGLVTVAADAGRKVVSLTDEGRSSLEAREDTDPFGRADHSGERPDLRLLVEQLREAVRHVARAGTDSQVAAAAAILEESRRAVYRLLAEEGADAGTAQGVAADA